MRRPATRIAALLAALALLAAGAAPAAGSAAASSRCEQMRSWLRAGGGGASGLLVVDADTGAVACGRAAARPRILASNMKIFTTATALSRLGPHSRIPTRVFADGEVDAGGTLRGSLYLKGGGDPALGTPAFYNRYRGGLGTNLFALRAQIRAAGIRAITGRLYADDSVFDRRRGVPDSGFATSPYVGPLSGLAFNSGFRGATSYSGFAPDPARLAARKLARSLRAGGVRVPARVARGRAPARAERVAVVRSPTVHALADFTNVYSDNFFAETMIKLLGARLGRGGTTAAGAAVVRGFARSLGSDVQAADGSGLTRSNRASPRQVVDLLRGMREDPAGEEFIQDLPLSGTEGTLTGRTTGSAAYRRCRAKTGTISGVSTLSGYCFNRSGRIMAFSILMNSVRSSATARYYQDRIAALIASY